jgi:hypothetical protein
MQEHFQVLGPAQSFCTLLDEALLEQAEAEKLKPLYYPLRPSAAGYCSRKLAYELAAFNGTQEKIWEDRRPSVIRLLALGSAIEGQSLKELELIPGFQVKFKQQVVEMFKLPSGRIIEGSVDAVMWSSEHKALLDVKSVGLRYHSTHGNSWEALIDKYDKLSTMQRFDRNAWWIEKPSEFLKEVGEDALVANICQINLYTCSSFMQDRGIKMGVVYRYNKANSEHMEVRFKPDQELFEAIKEKYTLIETSPPDEVPKDFVIGSQACAFCVYASRCWPEKDAKKEYIKTFPKLEEGLAEIEATPELAKPFAELAKYEALLQRMEQVETSILKVMIEKDIERIQLSDGQIYKKVFLKSPKPHYELRRSPK